MDLDIAAAIRVALEGHIPAMLDNVVMDVDTIAAEHIDSEGARAGIVPGKLDLARIAGFAAANLETGEVSRVALVMPEFRHGILVVCGETSIRIWILG